MRIDKKVKCIACGDVINVDQARNFKCTCGKVIITEGKILSSNSDYIDVSPQLLNE